MNRKLKKGFTLIELLVVIAIIGLLMALIMPTLALVRKNAAIAAQKGALQQIYAAVESLRQSVNQPSAFLYDADKGRTTPNERTNLDADIDDDAQMKKYPTLFVRELNPRYSLWAVNDFTPPSDPSDITTGLTSGLKLTFNPRDKRGIGENTPYSGVQYKLGLNSRALAFYDFKESRIDLQKNTYVDTWKGAVYYWILEVPMKIKGQTTYDTNSDGKFDIVNQIEMYFSFGPKGIPDIGIPDYFATPVTVNEPFGKAKAYGMHRAAFKAWLGIKEKRNVAEEFVAVIGKEKVLRDLIKIDQGTGNFCLPDPDELKVKFAASDYWTFSYTN